MCSINEILSLEDCKQIIEADQRTTTVEDVAVINYSTETIPGQPGYLGAYMYLDIDFQIANGSVASKRYFMKSLPYHDQKLTEAVEEWGIFRKEAELYRHLFNRFERDRTKVTKWAPACLLPRSNLIVLEDLTRAGFRTLPIREQFSEQHMKLVFDRLAQMHACSFHHEHTQLGMETIGSLFDNEILFETTFTPKSGWFVAGLKGIQEIAVQRNRYSSDPAHVSIMREQLWSCLERVYALSERTDHFRSVVVHRDLWFNNIMFRSDKESHEPNECMLIDFQLARYLPPAVDFLCALYLLTDREHRDRLTATYTDYYFNTLQQKLSTLGLDGTTILPRAEFEITLEHYRLVGLVWAGVLHGFVNFPSGFLDQLHHDDPETYTRMSMDDRNDFILKYYDCDQFYRERLDDVVTELLEFLFSFR